MTARPKKRAGPSPDGSAGRPPRGSPRPARKNTWRIGAPTCRRRASAGPRDPAARAPPTVRSRSGVITTTWSMRRRAVRVRRPAAGGSRPRPARRRRAPSTARRRRSPSSAHARTPLPASRAVSGSRTVADAAARRRRRRRSRPAASAAGSSADGQGRRQAARADQSAASLEHRRARRASHCGERARPPGLAARRRTACPSA